MNHAEFQLQALGDPRLAVHATSALPAWLWSSDGTRILWANPVGARVFGYANATALAPKRFGPADPHRRQVARLAGRLPANGAIRLERLQGFGAATGGLATCGCSRIDFPDGSHGILIVVGNIAGRTMPLVERLQRLVDGIDRPIAAFARDGMLIAASDAARRMLGFRNLSEAGLDEARDDALKQGRVETSFGISHMVLQRVGSGADIGLIALTAPEAAQEPEQPTPLHEAAAEITLFDAFAEPPVPQATESTVADEPSEPDLQSVLQLDLPHVEATPARAPQPETLPPAPEAEIDPHEPSPYVEAVADEPSPAPANASSWLDAPLPHARRLPLRFMWQMDREGRFTLATDEFAHLIGPRTVAGFGRLWSEIAETFKLDPDGRVMQAFATRATWSGIALNWPVDGGGRLPVELSGLPVFDRAQNFAGYRGFGVCRDLDGLARLAALRRHELFDEPAAAQPLSADIMPPVPPHDSSAADSVIETSVVSPPPAESPEPIASEPSHRTGLEMPVEPPNEMPTETPKNVLPFRPPGDAKPPSLTPVENSAFNELARQLSARLETEMGADATPEVTGIDETVVEEPTSPDLHDGASEARAAQPPEWLAPSEPPARGEAMRDKALLDLLPVGILIYRLDRLLYANAAFLEQIGYPGLHALEEAGGLDALYVEPGVSTASSTSDTGTPVRISASQPSEQQTSSTAADARLYTISWDGDSALALIFSGTRNDGAAIAAAITQATPLSEPTIAAPSPVGQANAEELGAILDTTAEGIVMFDADGNINSANRSAEALFGYSGIEISHRNLADLFAPESRHAVFDYLASVKSTGVASLLDHGREVLGRESKGGIIPLSVTMGRTQPAGPNFFAMFRDLSQAKKTESELREARRLAERATNAKADVLARISHEVRTPLNAIIGFAEVMIGERFGALGNERYAEYMKDIRASGERVISIINDLLDLSRIETGKLDLAFTSQNLNELVESCVAVMQPQANRERIIIRTSLAHTLPPVIADARALRQITLNLIGNSIHLANAGGQVIVSTALSDFGEVMLRVRDTGHGLNDNEVAAALEPFRTSAPSDQASESSPVNLSLTKALVEANRAKFQIKTGARSGTLIEVVFSHATARV
jgi:PAS domain S-box-containing protein